MMAAKVQKSGLNFRLEVERKQRVVIARVEAAILATFAVSFDMKCAV